MEVLMNRIELMNKNALLTFENELIRSDLSEKRIRRHMFNVHFFLSDYLEDYHGDSVENSLEYLEEYFEDWFLRKAIWSVDKGIKETITSFNKFYKVMFENFIIDKHTYKEYKLLIKEKKNIWSQPNTSIGPIDLAPLKDYFTDEIDDYQYCVIHEKTPYFFSLEKSESSERLRIFCGMSGLMNRLSFYSQLSPFDQLNYNAGFLIDYNTATKKQEAFSLTIGKSPATLTYGQDQLINHLIPELSKLIESKETSSADFLCIENGLICSESLENISRTYVETLELYFTRNEQTEKKILKSKKKSQTIHLCMMVIPPEYIQEYYQMQLVILDESGNEIRKVVFYSYNKDQVIYDFLLDYFIEVGCPKMIYSDELPIKYNLHTMLNEMNMDWALPNEPIEQVYKTTYYFEAYKTIELNAFIRSLGLVKKYDAGIEKCLSGLSVEYVKQLYRALDGHGKANKSDMIHYLLDKIVENIDETIGDFDQESIKVMLTISNHMTLFVDKENLLDYKFLIEAGLVYITEMNSQYIVWMPKEIKDCIQVRKESLNNHISTIQTLQPFTLACLNLYGVLTCKTYFDILRTVLKPSLEELETFEKNFEIHFDGIYGDLVDGVILHESFFGQINEDAVKILNQNKPYYTTDKETFLLFADEMYLEDTKEREDLLRHLKSKMNIPTERADDLIFDIKDSLETNDIEEILAMLEHFGYNFTSDKAINNLLQLIYKYNNSCRLWINHGHTPVEIASSQVRTSKKIGRNDPCPCGSGKKYKKCCGLNRLH